MIENKYLNGSDLNRARYLVRKAKPLVRENLFIIWPILRVIFCCCHNKKDEKHDSSSDSDREDILDEKKKLLKN